LIFQLSLSFLELLLVRTTSLLALQLLVLLFESIELGRPQNNFINDCCSSLWVFQNFIIGEWSFSTAPMLVQDRVDEDEVAVRQVYFDFHFCLRLHFQRKSIGVKKAVELPKIACSPAIEMNEMNETKWIGYARISTDSTKQGSSLDNQEEIIRSFVHRTGGQLLEIIKEEVSGTDDAREGLRTALELCRKGGCRLVVAKLDRLGRSVRKIQEILDSEVEFTAVDFPQGTRMQFQLLACFAEFEAKTISERVRKSMQFLKSQGRKFGSPKILETQKMGTKANRKKCQDYIKDIRPLAEGLRNSGHTLKSISSRLNDLKIRTRYGKEWNEVSVFRLLKA
jgi:DNA invertase Pin-like site-specific DNA recombinase